MAYRAVDDKTLERVRRGEISGDDHKKLLTGVDLSGLDLSGCNLSHFNLKRSLLFKTNFSGAELFCTDLSEVDATAANFEHCNLTEAILFRTGLGHCQFHRAILFNADLRESTLSGAKLIESDLRSAKLSGARLRAASLNDADLTEANLCSADLTGADVTGAELRETNLKDCYLRELVGFQKAGWIGTDIRQVNFAGAYRIRREIMDQNYLHEFRSQGKLHEFAYTLWWLTSDCGRSIGRWAILIAVQVLFFAMVYQFVALDLGDYPTRFSLIYHSIVTMTTLGYGDVIPRSIPAQIVVSLQVLSGYVMLGGLLAILTNKLARRAD